MVRLLIHFVPSAGRPQQIEVSLFALAVCPEVAKATQRGFHSAHDAGYSPRKHFAERWFILPIGLFPWSSGWV